MSEDLAFAPVAELGRLLRRKDVSPVELVELALARIGRLDGTINAFIKVTAEEARRAALDAEKAIMAGDDKGPFHGVPVAIKDLYAMAGMPTTFGSPLYAGWVPTEDAAAVERLKRGGAAIVGKTNLHELAYGTTSANAHFGVVRNPWNPDCHPGGSSGGSAAAIAAGMVPMALGSDTGASIRQPAACCGLVGLKPTYGRVSKHGCLPLAWSMDHAGALNRTVADAALTLNLLAGYDPRDHSSVSRPVPDFSSGLGQGVRGRRLALCRGFFFERTDPEIAAAVEVAAGEFAALGASVLELELADMDAAYAAGSLTIMVEGAAFHAADLSARPMQFSDELRAAFELGSFYKAVDYVQAQRLRARIMASVAEAMASVDALLMPTTPVPATLIEDSPPDHPMLRPRNTLPFNLLGLPAISLPCGFTAGGLPIGLQIVGKAFDEAGLLEIAHGYEQATAWHRRRPPLERWEHATSLAPQGGAGADERKEQPL